MYFFFNSKNKFTWLKKVDGKPIRDKQNQIILIPNLFPPKLKNPTLVCHQNSKTNSAPISKNLTYVAGVASNKTHFLKTTNQNSTKVAY